MERKPVDTADIVGRVRHTPSPSIGLELLGATGFVQRARQIEMSDIAAAVDVFDTPPAHIPTRVEDFTKGLSKDARRTRDRSLSGLNWDGAQYKLRYAWQTPSGELIQIEERGRRRSEGIIDGIFRNVTAEVRDAKRAAWLAEYDAETDLFHAARFRKSLDHLCALSRRNRSHGALLRLRMSNLSDLNAVYGHETGGRLLSAFARRLSLCVRTPDILGRLSGREFGVALYGASPASVAALAERLRHELCETPVEGPHGPLFGEFDMSVTLIGATAHDADTALAQSEVALSAPDARNLAIYEPSMGQARPVKAKAEFTEGDIIAALNERRIRLAYQPIVSARTRELHHYEALLRLIREDGEVVSAGLFIMAAERLGLVHLLDRRALELASDALAADAELHLALNVSAGTVKDEETAEGYLTALKALGPAAKRVTIELTETVALDDPAMASRFSIETRALGCQFAIDDFGSGYTTFRNLMAIEADCIKIDGSFIQGVATEKHLQTFVRMMVDLAQTFSVKTVAEMVDSRADAEILRRLGVDYLQGFMFGVPSAAPSRQRKAS